MRLCQRFGSDYATNAKAAGYEADDFLAAAVAKEERRGGTVMVATGDRDAYQLASDRTTILQPIKAGEMARIRPAAVRERYGVEPHQVPDFIALRGDASDRIPGAKGIRAKTAAALLRKHASLEDLIAGGRFQAQAKELRLYRKIATMDRAAPIPRLRNQKPTWDRASALARAGSRCNCRSAIVFGVPLASRYAFEAARTALYGCVSRTAIISCTASPSRTSGLSEAVQREARFLSWLHP